MRALALLALLVFTMPLAAAENAEANVYKGLMSDKDLYVGEGLVQLEDYAGDQAKAQAAGRERARGNLAENIRVVVTSEINDVMTAKGSETTARSSSRAVVELEDLQYKVLEGYPKAGQLTVLAYLSKDDYKRQQDQRVLPYRPHRALRLSGGMMINAGMENDGSKYNNPPAGISMGSRNSGPGSGFQGLQADFFWDSWFVGLRTAIGGKQVVVYDPKSNQAFSGYAVRDQPMNVTALHLGYEWTPWATRFQVSFPMQLEYGFMSWDPYFSSGYGVAAGTVFRYWAADRVAFDFGFRWHQGLSNAAIATSDGKQLVYRPAIGSNPTELGSFSLTGADLTAGIMWNGF